VITVWSPIPAANASTAMICVAPLSIAPAAARSPIGPGAKTTTVSPIRIRPLAARANPVLAMLGHINPCSSVG
jgi:hypothetical protein